MPSTPIGKGNPRKVSKEEKTAQRSMHSRDSRDDSVSDTSSSGKLLPDSRNGRATSEDIVQSFDASISLKKKQQQPNADENVREMKRKTSVYSLVNFDSKISANRRSNVKQDKDSDGVLDDSINNESNQR